MIVTVFSNFMNHNKNNTRFINRDTFRNYQLNFKVRFEILLRILKAKYIYLLSSLPNMSKLTNWFRLVKTCRNFSETVQFGPKLFLNGLNLDILGCHICTTYQYFREIEKKTYFRRVLFQEGRNKVMTQEKPWLQLARPPLSTKRD